MIQSFLVYGLFALLLWKLGKIAATREKLYHSYGREKVPFWTWEIILSLLIFAIISGIRWQVGVDHLNYLEGYERVLNRQTFNKYGYSEEMGFEIITSIFALFNIHYTFYFGFWAFLQLFFIYYAVRRERYLLPFIGLLIIWGSHYLSWMNGIRQMVAACIFVYSIQFIRDRKLFPYIITILLASVIHRSAILLLIFYFIPQIDYFKYRWLNFVLLGITLVIGFNPIWLQSMDFLERLLFLIGYEQYSKQLDIMVEYRREMNFGPRRLSVLFLYGINIWYATKLKDAFKGTNYLIYFNFMYLGAILYNLFANTSHIFLRPVSYFTIFSIMTTAYLMYYLKPNRKNFITFEYLIVFIIAISYLMFSIVIDAYSGEIDYTNYKFYFNQ